MWGERKEGVNFHWLLSNCPENPATGNSAITVQAEKGRHPSRAAHTAPLQGLWGSGLITGLSTLGSS